MRKKTKGLISKYFGRYRILFSNESHAFLAHSVSVVGIQLNLIFIQRNSIAKDIYCFIILLF